MEGVVMCSANYVPLSPISFLERAAAIFRERTSIIYGSVMYTWKDTYDRCRRLASALKQMGISRGDVVAVMAPNVPAMYELHFGVPMAGAILSTLNTRYDSSMVSVLLMQSEAKIIFVDYQFLEIVRETLHLLSQKKTKLPILVLISELDPSMPTTRSASTSLVHFEYESLLRTAKVEFEFQSPADECEPISISYTSGTTANPKGVVYSHRGAFLNAIATVLLIEMRSMPVFLWTVPMFHCNGWCLSWGVAAQGGTNICLRNVTPEVIFDCITLHKVTHMGGAPTILNMIVNAQIGGDQVPLPNKVVVITGGAAPPPSVLFNIEKKGFVVIHAYGMTETYGAGAVCTWMPEWDSLPGNEQAKLKSRQGLHHLGMADLDVKDPITMKSVQSDGKTIGEVMFRGNTVMSGYFKDLKATQDSMGGGWFRTRDLAVKHPDGYIEVKDWTKDIIISGGENISSIDVESVLFSHPAILEVAVVGRPDDRWGESVCAFVKLKDGCDACAEEIVGFCRDRLPHHMAPWTVVFEDLPKTSTGKTQKFVLREKAKAMGSL